ncbi:MAG: hypothetical protein RLZZ387_3274 [Chloroflexota bacterium]
MKEGAGDEKKTCPVSEKDPGKATGRLDTPDKSGTERRRLRPYHRTRPRQRHHEELVGVQELARRLEVR